LRNDFIRTITFFGEFFGWPSGAEELRFDVHFVADLKVWRRDAATIGRLLVTSLSVFDVEFKLSWSSPRSMANSRARVDAMSRSGVDVEVRMITLVGEEGRCSCGFARCVVVREFGEREQSRPVILLVVAIAT